MKIIHKKIKNVERITKGMDSPSTPSENLKLSLLNQENVFTNWKWGIDLSKFMGRYNDNKKVLVEVHIADFFDSFAKSSPSGESKTNAKPTRGKTIKIGKIGRFNITKYKYIYLKIK